MLPRNENGPVSFDGAVVYSGNPSHASRCYGEVSSFMKYGQ
jgi:hypothetical protein